MAEQISVLTRTLVELRARVLWLVGGSVIAIVLALIAIFVAASR
jgi:hypothetical protein